jgi:hypothetical protein
MQLRGANDTPMPCRMSDKMAANVGLMTKPDISRSAMAAE